MTDQPQGTPLPTENKTAEVVDTAIADGAQAADQIIDKAAETSEPILAAPVIKQLFEALVKWLLGVASRTGQLFITFGITRSQGNAENSSLVSADKEVEDAIKSGDQNAIAKAEQDFQKAQSSAVNSDGSAQPK